MKDAEGSGDPPFAGKSHTPEQRYRAWSLVIEGENAERIEQTIKAVLTVPNICSPLKTILDDVEQGRGLANCLYEVVLAKLVSKRLADDRMAAVRKLLADSSVDINELAMRSLPTPEHNPRSAELAKIASQEIDSATQKLADFLGKKISQGKNTLDTIMARIDTATNASLGIREVV